jgi:hypothetical protein
MNTTLNELVRDQILAEGPEIEQSGNTQASYVDACNNYVDEQLNMMTNIELLERISDALYQVTEGLSVRLEARNMIHNIILLVLAYAAIRAIFKRKPKDLMEGRLVHQTYATCHTDAGAVMTERETGGDAKP